MWSKIKSLRLLILVLLFSLSGLSCKDQTTLDKERLALCVANNNNTELEDLLAKGGNPNLVLSTGWSLLYHAAMKGQCETIKVLLKYNSDIELGGQDYPPPLHVASLNGHYDAVKLLIENGANVNSISKKGDTPLTCAKSYRHDKVASLLLKHGAKDKANFQEKNALILAFEEKNTKTMKMLLEKGVDINIRNANDESLLDSAISDNDPKIIKFLIENGININARDKKDGNTPLMKAVEVKNIQTVKLLLDAKVNVNMQNKHEWTALDIAQEWANEELQNLLRQYGAKTSKELDEKKNK